MALDIRPPIVVVVGHVDVGKTLLLDKIRGTAVAYREPGMITQHIGMSLVPWPAVERFAGPLLDRFKLRGKIWIPGFLFIDTPGHGAFSNLRKRGGSIADVAILVVDITSGLEEQTYESISLIRSRGVPFVIAANKVDRIYGWRPRENAPFITSVEEQEWYVHQQLEDMVARIAAQLSELGIEADRYDRVRNFLEQVPIVPTSAVTGEGVADLLLVLAGISQRFTREKLAVHMDGGKAVVMEVREERGLGPVADVVLYDGTIRRGDTIVTLGFEGPIVARAKMLIMPKPLDEMRDPEDRYRFVDEVRAAAGVRVVAEELGRSVAGAPLYVARDAREVERLVRLVSEEVADIRIETDKEGVVAKADTLGTLESMVVYLKSLNIPVRLADIGPVSKRDLMHALLTRKRNPVYGVVLAFNVKVPPDVEKDATSMGIRIFSGEILYRLVEEYLRWSREEQRKSVEALLASVVRPAKVRLIPGYVFRRSDPAIVGVKVLGGLLRPGTTLMREDGRHVGRVLQIQHQGRTLNEARAGMEVAISIHGNVIVGRQVREGDTLYVDVPDDHLRTLLVDLREHLSPDELEVAREIADIKRRRRRQ